MKFLLSAFFVFTMLFSADLDWARKNFQTAHSNQTVALAFYQNTDKIATNNPVNMGYKAAGKIFKSKFEKNNKLKKELFKEGALNLNALIQANPQQVELRFIRLTIQQNTPSFLKYNSNINEDKQFVLDNYKFTEVTIQQMIKEYVNKSGKFTDLDKNSLT